jgi:hypothetical protein
LAIGFMVRALFSAADGGLSIGSSVIPHGAAESTSLATTTPLPGHLIPSLCYIFMCHYFGPPFSIGILSHINKIICEKYNMTYK